MEAHGHQRWGALRHGADGTPDRTSWTAEGSALAFVALDVNGNGIIDDGAELFGEYTWLPNGTQAENGFAALSSHDENKDGRIDEQDSIWQRLLLWTDTNHDGRSQRREIVPIHESAVEALETDYHATRPHDQFGNQFRFKSTVHVHSTGAKPYYDIFFIVQR